MCPMFLPGQPRPDLGTVQRERSLALPLRRHPGAEVTRTSRWVIPVVLMGAMVGEAPDV